MQTAFHKLIRDRIPEIIRADGYTCDIETMDEAEYQQALRQKLVEESCEVATASEQDLLSELADLHEVIEALMGSYNISSSTVKAVQEQRRTERGGFQQRLRLLYMTSPDDATNTFQ